jgi:ribosomal protein L37AE/L43A
MKPNSEETNAGNHTWKLFRAITAAANALRGKNSNNSDPSALKARPLRAYVVRKRELPHTFTEQDWQRALEYWEYTCAVCGRPRGLWHTLAADHWIPLTDPDCPGTVPTNIVPLCHGESGCNNSKRAKSPQAWLEAKLGPKQAFQKMLEIDAYFLWVKDLMTERLGCPVCGEPVLYCSEDDVWLCTYCDAEWSGQGAREFKLCPACQCWMVETEEEAENIYRCPRCKIEWTEADLPAPEACPGCGEGVLEWDYEPDGPPCGYWRCTVCGGEWVFEWEQ